MIEIPNLGQKLINLVHTFYASMGKKGPPAFSLTASRKFGLFKKTDRCPICVERTDSYRIVTPRGQLPNFQKSNGHYVIDLDKMLAKIPDFAVCPNDHATVRYQIIDNQRTIRTSDEVDVYQICQDGDLIFKEHRRQFRTNGHEPQPI